MKIVFHANPCTSDNWKHNFDENINENRRENMYKDHSIVLDVFVPQSQRSPPTSRETNNA